MPLLQRALSVFRKQRNPRRRKFEYFAPYRIVLIGVTVAAAAWINVLVHLSKEKALAEQTTVQTAANLTRVFEEHTLRAVKTVDQTLLFIRAAYQADPARFDLMQWSQTNPLLADLLLQVSIVDRDGNRVLTSVNSEIVIRTNLRDRDYFQFHLHSTGDELFIGKPIIGRASGQPSIPVTRRLLTPDGSFAGVVVASLSSTHLSRLYDSIDVGTLGAIVLVGTDGIVRARGDAGDDRRPIGQSLAGSPLMQSVTRSSSGSFHSAGLLDGIIRVFTYRKVRDLPLIVEVGFAEDEIFAGYRRDRQASLATATLLSALLAGAMIFALRRHHRLQAVGDALSQSEIKYRSVVDNLNEVVFQTDLDGRLTFLNPVWTTLTGFSAAESLGHTLYRYVAPNDRPLYAWHIQPIIDGRAKGSSQDMRFLAKNGSLCWFEVHAHAMHREDGKIMGLSGTLGDITQRKVMELELQHSRESLDRAQQIAQVGSFDHNVVTGKVEWSDELYRIYGLDPGEGGAGIDLARSLVIAEDQERFSDSGPIGRDNLPIPSIDYRIVRPDGSERILHRECDITLDSAGNPIRIFGTTQDITERKQVEEALREARDTANRSARAKSEFLAVMSHEIRSPMNGVVGLVDLLRQTSLDAEQKQMLDMAHESANSLLAVLNDILDFSKIEAGKIVVAPEPLELRHFVTSVCETLAHTASRKGLIFETLIEPSVPDWIRTDPVRLRQILVNLLGNAVKFTTQGSVRLAVAPLPDAENGPMLSFTVADTGIGMSEDVVSRLFMPFNQADASTTRDFGGTGLGLSISKRLAELLDGKIEVASKAGVGSTFALLLPLVAEEKPATPALPADGGGDRRDFSGRRALIAEDLPTNRWLIVRQLQTLGLPADAVENGQAALAALATRSYDLLITDFHMPKMDGMKLTACIREGEAAKGGLRLPILGLTADASLDSRERCLAAGMDWVVSKPTDLRSLSEALRRLLLPQSVSVSAPVEKLDPDAIFDDHTFHELFKEGDPEGVEWLTALLEAAQDLFAQLRMNVAIADRPAIAATAHRLAGVALSGGAMRLGKICRAMEADAKNGSTDFAALIETAQAALDGAREEIAPYMTSRKEAAV